MISIVYWSQTGNTQAMAEAISEGVTEAGKEAKIIDVTDASLDALKAEKVFALGCPAMGAEVLEESRNGTFCIRVGKKRWWKDHCTLWLIWLG